MNRLVALSPLLALLALAALFVGFGLRRDPHVTPAALVGKPLPTLTLKALDGAPRPLAAAAHGPMLVNVFASWCGPCAEEAPALMALKDTGVPLVGLAYKDDAAATRRFLAARGDPFTTVLLDPDGAAGVEFGISGVPETFAVDAHGRIAAKHAGALTPRDAEALLDAAGLR